MYLCVYMYVSVCVCDYICTHHYVSSALAQWPWNTQSSSLISRSLLSMGWKRSFLKKKWTYTYINIYVYTYKHVFKTYKHEVKYSYTQHMHITNICAHMFTNICAHMFVIRFFFCFFFYKEKKQKITDYRRSWRYQTLLRTSIGTMCIYTLNPKPFTLNQP